MNIKKINEKQNEDEINKYEKNEKEVKEKLALISLKSDMCYSFEKKYHELKAIIEYINQYIKKLIFIRDSLMIYHKNIFNNEIQEIQNIINEIENCQIINLRSEEMKVKLNEKIQRHECLCSHINMVKDFLLFNMIYENTQGKDELNRFNEANYKLHDIKMVFKRNESDIERIFKVEEYSNIIKDIKEELSEKDESESALFINKMIEYFNILDKSIIEDLIILINSKKYEIIVKGIKYFFDNYTNEKLKMPENLNLSQMELEVLKRTLNELKQNNIFDYKNNSHYYKVFTSLYEKAEAINFLKKYTNANEKDLSNKLRNNLEIISIKDINDTIECLTHFKKFENKNALEIINNIKLLSEEQIAQFENYSKKFSYIIKLDK